jgi:CubicO group peptidase (beta-lactamase class C family)
MLAAVLLLMSPAIDTSLDLAAIRRAADYSASTGGIGVLVIQNGKDLFETYANGGSANRPHLLASGTKSFAGTLAMAAQEDGLLRLDEPVSDTLTEWKSDPRKRRITIRQLLSLTSGLERGDNGRPGTYVQAVEARAVAEPGRRFAYGPVPFQAFGALLSRKLAPRNESVYRYLRRRILDPVDLRDAFWTGRAKGEPNLPSGAYMTAREWAKFGLAILNRGGGVLKPSSVTEMLKGTDANPGYGLSWWLNRPGTLSPTGTPFSANGRYWPGGPTDAFMAAGAGNQRLYILPHLNAVVVRQGRQAPYKDAEFLDRLVGRK